MSLTSASSSSVVKLFAGGGGAISKLYHFSSKKNLQSLPCSNSDHQTKRRKKERGTRKRKEVPEGWPLHSGVSVVCLVFPCVPCHGL